MTFVDILEAGVVFLAFVKTEAKLIMKRSGSLKGKFVQ